MKALTLVLPVLFLLAPLAPSVSVGDPFHVRIVDEDGRGVPDVQLTADNGIVCYTKDNGDVAWSESSLMNRDVHFKIRRGGYRFPDGGATIRVVHGGRTELKILQ